MASPEAKRALLRVGERARMLSDTGEEDSVVIEQRAAAKDVPVSVPAPAKVVTGILAAVNSWPKVVALALLLAFAAFAIVKGFKLV